MTNHNIIIGLLIVSGAAHIASAQQSPALLDMLALYSDQEAVYVSISDSTAVSFEKSQYLYDRQFRSEAMVLRKGGGGVANAATPVISLGDSIIIKAFTIDPQGETAFVKDDEINLISLYGGKKRYSAGFADTRAGAIFVFQWHLFSREPIFSGRRFLGRSYPVLDNRTVISCPEAWVFDFLVSPSCLYRQLQSSEYLNNGEIWVNHIWTAATLPGLAIEDDSPPAIEFIPCLNYAFSYDKRWPDGAKKRVDWAAISLAYEKHMQSLTMGNEIIDDDLREMTKEATNKLEKLRSIAEFMAQNLQAVYSDIDISDTPATLLGRGVASQAEAAFLMGTFLARAGIFHNYVLISTRDNGSIIKSLPALFFFNRLLIAAKIDADTFWLDPFYRGAPVGVLPFEDQAVEGLIVGNKTGAFLTTPISDYRENGHAVHLKVTFTPQGDLMTEAVELLSGSLNIDEKRILQDMSAEQRIQRWTELATKGLPGSLIRKLDISDIYSDVNPLRISYLVEVPGFIKPADYRIYIPSDILGRWQSSKLYSESRKVPIELGRPHSQQERITIELPEGYKVEFLPENFSLNSYLGEIFSVAVVTANTITITRGLSIKPYRLKPDAAKSLNGFYGTAKNQAGKFIILRK